MARFFKKRTESKNQAPGTPIFIGRKYEDELTTHFLQWNNEEMQEKVAKNAFPKDLSHVAFHTKWLRIIGLHDVERIQTFAKQIPIDKLLLEDILSTAQRPNFQTNEKWRFLCLKLPFWDVSTQRLQIDQVSFYFTDQLLISFEERKTAIFDGLVERIRNKVARIREESHDYLAYVLADTIVDHYIELTEKLGDEVDHLEGEVLDESSSSTAQKLTLYRKEFSLLVKILKPSDEAILRFVQYTQHHSQELSAFLNDLRGLSIHVTESAESYRTLLQDYMALHQNNVSLRLNEIMKVLTLFSAFFIPLSFIAGVYGTNFNILPETQWTYGYAYFWGVLLSCSGFLFWYFKKKKWL